MTDYGKKAINLVKQAGTIILANYSSLSKPNVYEKSRYERVTNVDRHIHKLLAKELPTLYPVPVLSEESTKKWKKTDSYWVIDPVDGTTNFITRIPYFCIGVGLVIENTIVLNIVYNPVSKEMFYAEKNCGTYLNNHKLRKDHFVPVSKSIVSISYSHSAKSIQQAGLVGLKLRKTVHNTRPAGSTLLSFAYVAAGRLEASVVMGPITPWDSIPALLLIQEVHGDITDNYGNPYNIQKTKNLIASNGTDHARLVRIVSSVASKKSKRKRS